MDKVAFLNASNLASGVLVPKHILETVQRTKGRWKQASSGPLSKSLLTLTLAKDSVTPWTHMQYRSLCGTDCDFQKQAESSYYKLGSQPMFD